MELAHHHRECSLHRVTHMPHFKPDGKHLPGSGLLAAIPSVLAACDKRDTVYGRRSAATDGMPAPRMHGHSRHAAVPDTAQDAGPDASSLGCSWCVTSCSTRPVCAIEPPHAACACKRVSCGGKMLTSSGLYRMHRMTVWSLLRTAQSVRHSLSGAQNTRGCPEF